MEEEKTNRIKAQLIEMYAQILGSRVEGIIYVMSLSPEGIIISARIHKIGGDNDASTHSEVDAESER